MCNTHDVEFVYFVVVSFRGAFCYSGNKSKGVDYVFVTPQLYLAPYQPITGGGFERCTKSAAHGPLSTLHEIEAIVEKL